MKQKRRKFKTNKAVLSVSTSFLVLSSIVSAAGSASQLNEFVLSTDKNYVSEGDCFCLNIDYLPDSQGISGFTFDIHYDPAAVTPSIPEDDEDWGAEGFFVVPTVSEGEGVIRIVGAYLTGDNYKKDVRIASIDFTVLDTSAGQADYWLDFENAVFFDGENYVNTDVAAPNSSAPYAVGLFENELPVTQPAETQPAVTEEGPAVTEAPVTEAVTETEPVTESNIVPEEPVVVELEMPDVTEPVPETTEAPVPELDLNESSAVSAEESTEPVFEYSEAPYSEETEATSEPIQYGFNISDNITDYSDTYDIRVKLNTTGFANGCIGMMDNYGNWQSQSFETEYGQDEWVFTDLDPNSCWDQVFVQVYYLQYGADIEIESVEFIPHSSYYSAPAAEAPVVDEAPDTTEISAVADTEKNVLSTSTANSVPAADVIKTAPRVKAPAEESSSSSDTSSVEESKADNQPEESKADSQPETAPVQAAPADDKPEETPADTSSAAPAETPAEQQPAKTTPADTTGTTGTQTETSAENKAEVIEKVVEQRTEEANKNSSSTTTSNPNTGRHKALDVLNIFRAAAALIMGYSLFAAIYNKFSERKTIRR
ncbi:cohesin domain-containing protein [Ruminococcus sp.]|uniref:cohesin domain-containing protein n=1 Tax=Ruminococcus sp. TaxID=41978 RepID=UPI0025DDC069|nr:cohesin domain-containing protein [Ruminococcus sp.]MBQ8967911.1 hypothetical protein [Ruminococcus sp.]